MTEVSDAEIEDTLRTILGTDVPILARRVMRFNAMAGDARLRIMADQSEEYKRSMRGMIELSKRFVARDPVEIEHAKGNGP